MYSVYLCTVDATHRSARLLAASKEVIGEFLNMGTCSHSPYTYMFSGCYIRLSLSKFIASWWFIRLFSWGMGQALRLVLRIGPSRWVKTLSYLKNHKEFQRMNMWLMVLFSCVVPRPNQSLVNLTQSVAAQRSVITNFFRSTETNHVLWRRWVSVDQLLLWKLSLNCYTSPAGPYDDSVLERIHPVWRFKNNASVWVSCISR